MIEIWKDIKETNDKYSVSSLWRIRNNKTNRILVKTISDRWYERIVLFKNCYRIHRLVARYFIENGLNKPEVNHIDWNMLNNCVNNLERCTRSENMYHCYNITKSRVWINKWKYWILNHNSKIVYQYSKDMVLIRKWDCVSDIGRDLWLCSKCISRCCRDERKSTYGFIWRYSLAD